MNTCPRCGGADGAHYALCVIARLVERIFGPEYPATGPVAPPAASTAALEQQLREAENRQAELLADLDAAVAEAAEWRRIADHATAPEPDPEDPWSWPTPPPDGEVPPPEEPPFEEPTPEPEASADFPEVRVVQWPTDPAERVVAYIQQEVALGFLNERNYARGDWLPIPHLYDDYQRVTGDDQLSKRRFGEYVHAWAKGLGLRVAQGPAVDGRKPMLVFGVRWADESRNEPKPIDSQATPWVESFLEQRFIRTDDPEDRVPVARIHAMYAAWQKRHEGAPEVGGNIISRVLMANGIQRLSWRPEGGTTYLGLRIKSIADTVDEQAKADHKAETDEVRALIKAARKLGRESTMVAAVEPRDDTPTAAKTNNGWVKYPRAEAPENLTPDVVPPSAEVVAQAERATERKAAYTGDHPGRELKNAEYRKLAQALVEQGWTYFKHNPRGNGKPRAVSPDGAHTISIPNTPSDVRGVRNARSYLRKLGVEV